MASAKDGPALRLLTTSVTQKLCSGQLIVSVAAVVKELLENALDAGASAVWVTLSSDLRTIKVRDDGKGIPPGDRMSVGQHHCTSKLRSFGDIGKVSTYGFRGEALYLCSVAAKRLTITTRVSGEPTAAQIVVEHGVQTAPPRPAASAAQSGTTVTVSGLFDAFPVRRKRLADRRHKAKAISAVRQTLLRYALASPLLRLSCNLPQLRKLTTQTTAESISSLFSASLLAGLAPVTPQPDAPVQVSGYWPRITADASIPGLFRSQADCVFLFINGRPVDSRALRGTVRRELRAVYTGSNDDDDDDIDGSGRAATTRVLKSKYPFAVIRIDMPHGDVDVNVSPDKAELFFRDKSAVESALAEALQRSSRDQQEAKAQNEANKEVQAPFQAVAVDSTPVMPAPFGEEKSGQPMNTRVISTSPTDAARSSPVSSTNRQQEAASSATPEKSPQPSPIRTIQTVIPFAPAPADALSSGSEDDILEQSRPTASTNPDTPRPNTSQTSMQQYLSQSPPPVAGSKRNAPDDVSDSKGATPDPPMSKKRPRLAVRPASPRSADSSSGEESCEFETPVRSSARAQNVVKCDFDDTAALFLGQRSLGRSQRASVQFVGAVPGDKSQLLAVYSLVSNPEKSRPCQTKNTSTEMHSSSNTDLISESKSQPPRIIVACPHALERHTQYQNLLRTHPVTSDRLDDPVDLSNESFHDRLFELMKRENNAKVLDPETAEGPHAADATVLEDYYKLERTELSARDQYVVRCSDLLEISGYEVSVAPSSDPGGDSRLEIVAVPSDRSVTIRDFRELCTGILRSGTIIRALYLLFNFAAFSISSPATALQTPGIKRRWTLIHATLASGHSFNVAGSEPSLLLPYFGVKRTQLLENR